MISTKYHQIVPLERLAPAIYLDLQTLYNTLDRPVVDKALRKHCREVVNRHWRIFPTTCQPQLFQPRAIIPMERDYTGDELYLLCRMGLWEERHRQCKQTGFLWEEDWLKYLNTTFRRTCFECAQKTRPKAVNQP